MSLSSKAKEVHEAFGITEDSIMMLEEIIRNDNDLVNEALRSAAVDALMRIQRTCRKTITRTAIEPPKEKFKPKTFTQEMQDAVTAATKMYLWPMMDGSPLGEATREHILLDAEKYKANAIGNLKSYKFLNMVGGKLKPGEKVADKVPEEELRRLMLVAQDVSI